MGRGAVGRPLRWWQRLAATRMLEVDERRPAGVGDDDPVDAAAAREVVAAPGAVRCGGSIRATGSGSRRTCCTPGRTSTVCKEVQRPARVWAKQRAGVSGAGGERAGRDRAPRRSVAVDAARRRAVYGFACRLAAADEAWKVKPSSIEEGVEPTMVEREQPQLLLVSTAHRLSTSLMLGRRQARAGGARARRRGSADRVVGTAGGRHRRRRGVAARVGALVAAAGAARSGSSSRPRRRARWRTRRSPTRSQSFRAQWLNQWPPKLAEPSGGTEDLLPARAVGRPRAGRRRVATGPMWVAVEDDYGLGRRGRGRRAARRRPARGRRRGRADDWDDAIDGASNGSPSTARSGSSSSARRCSTGSPPASAPCRSRAGGDARPGPGSRCSATSSSAGSSSMTITTIELDEAARRRRRYGRHRRGLILIAARGRTHLVNARWCGRSGRRTNPPRSPRSTRHFLPGK